MFRTTIPAAHLSLSSVMVVVEAVEYTVVILEEREVEVVGELMALHNQVAEAIGTKTGNTEGENVIDIGTKDSLNRVTDFREQSCLPLLPFL